MDDVGLDRALIAVGRKVQAQLRSHLRHDLTLTQAWIMGLLDQNARMALSEIADQLDLNLSAASSAVDQLIRTNWVERGSNPLDRRVVVVSLTEAGRQMVVEAKTKRQEIMAFILACLDEDEANDLHRILRKLDQALVVQSNGKKEEIVIGQDGSSRTPGGSNH